MKERMEWFRSGEGATFGAAAPSAFLPCDLRLAEERRRQKSLALDRVRERQARKQRQLKREQELELAQKSAAQQHALAAARAAVEAKNELVVLSQVLCTRCFVGLYWRACFAANRCSSICFSSSGMLTFRVLWLSHP